jgi:hypothetical protein
MHLQKNGKGTTIAYDTPCMDPPYENPKAVSGLKNSLPRDILCDARRVLYQIMPKRQTTTLKNNKKGSEERIRLMNRRQLEYLKEFISKYQYFYEDFVINTEYPTDLEASEPKSSRPNLNLNIMIDMLIIVGRWLHPLEIKGIFGENIKVYNKVYRIATAREKNNSKNTNNANVLPFNSRLDWTTDPRISFLIGKNGSRLNHITQLSGCIYIWIEGDAVSMYATSPSDEPFSLKADEKFEHAKSMINDVWHSYDPRRSPIEGPPGTLYLAEGSQMLPITMEMLYNIIS